MDKKNKAMPTEIIDKFNALVKQVLSSKSPSKQKKRKKSK